MMERNMCRQMMRKAVCMAMAIPAAFSCTYLLRTGLNYTMINHSLVGVLLWWACWQVMERASRHMNRRLAAVSVPLGLMFAMMMVFGSMLYEQGSARMFQLKTWVGVVCAAPLFAAVSALFMDALPRAKAVRLPWAEDRLSRLTDRQFYLLCWGLIFAAWLPGLIASYPGVYGYDCIYQIDYYRKGAISTHHPLLHTWWLGFCVVTLGDWLGSPEAGMCVYSIMQMIVFSASFASILAYLRSRRAGVLMQLACLIAFMFMPTNAILSFSGTKDVVFAAMVIWTLIWMLRNVENAEALRTWGAWARLVALGMGMMLLRKQGIYVFLFALFFGLLVMKGQRRRVLAAMLAAVALFGVYQGPVSTLLKAERVEDVQEMLSVPIMQLSAAHMNHNYDMPQDTKTAIESYIPQWDNYDFTTRAIADPMKNTFNAQLYRQDPSAFWKLWARTGAAYPETYIDAFLRLTLGWWYPDAHFRDPASYHPYYEYRNTYRENSEWLILDRTTPTCLRWLSDLYLNLSDYNTDQKIPVISMFTSSGLAAWVMFLFIRWAIYRRRWRMLMPAALLLGLWGTLLLGPVVILRYSYSLIMAVPLLVESMRE